MFLVACLGALSSASFVTPAVPAARERLVPVVIQLTGGDTAAVERAITDAGGDIGVGLPIVAGFAARVPESALHDLRRHPDVAGVAPDRTVHVTSDDADGSSPPAPTSVVADEVGVRAVHGRGVTGAGVAVALVDTGVTPVGDIADRLVEVAHPDRPGERAACVNLSGEATCDDSYGHGTFLAGLIAGSGKASGGDLAGMAPGASIVSVKIAGRDGSADVSKVLAAIQWVVSFRDEHNIRVLNLSLGTDSTAHYANDPLNLAVQRAWQSGITVVVAASNRGPSAKTISKPADDPLVITVGAIDDRGTSTIGDDRLPRFSGRGPTVHGIAKPDVVAPGGRVVSLVAPGSRVERVAPSAHPVYRRGSGTSMSAAVVSGVAALLHDAQPSWTPGQVKHALSSTARRVASSNRNAVGAGLIDADGASRVASPRDANAGVDVTRTGTGALDESRNHVRVTRPCETGRCPISGDTTAGGRPWNRDEYASGPWTGSSWYQSQWSGSSWYGSSWYSMTWAEGEWSGSSSDGTGDDDTDYGTSLHGSSWYGAWD